MTAKQIQEIVLVEQIEPRILLLRGERVMLDADLAALYGVATKVLNQAVKRNWDRFPADFLFQLAWKETQDLRSRSVTSSRAAREVSRSQSVTLKRGQNRHGQAERPSKTE